MTYVTVQLQDAPDLHLCHHHVYKHQFEFGDPSVSDCAQFDTTEDAMRVLSIYYPGIPTNLFLFTSHESVVWELMYSLPKIVQSKVVDHVKYVLQNDGQLAPYGQSANSRKFNSYDEGHRYATQLGILLSCVLVQGTTQDF